MITNAWNSFAHNINYKNMMQTLAKYLCTSVAMFQQHYVCEDHGYQQQNLVDSVVDRLCISSESQKVIGRLQQTVQQSSTFPAKAFLLYADLHETPLIELIVFAVQKKR